MSAVDVYPVGWCHAIILSSRMLRARLPWSAATANISQEWRYTKRCIQRGDWRAVKNSLNGWLAEPSPFPDDLNRCGSGWTRARALRDLDRRMRKVAA